MQSVMAGQLLFVPDAEIRTPGWQIDGRKIESNSVAKVSAFPRLDILNREDEKHT